MVKAIASVEGEEVEEQIYSALTWLISQKLDNNWELFPKMTQRCLMKIEGKDSKQKNLREDSVNLGTDKLDDVCKTIGEGVVKRKDE